MSNGLVSFGIGNSISNGMGSILDRYKYREYRDRIGSDKMVSGIGSDSKNGGSGHL